MRGKPLTGRFIPKNKEKYRGDPGNVSFRSSWERSVFKWCDQKPFVQKWSSEEVVIPYVCKSDGKYHRYFIDLWIKFSDGNEYLVEIKPHKQTMPPKQPKKRTKRYLNEVLTYTKNDSKWEAARKYAKNQGMTFCVWTEKELRKLGIPIFS